MANDGSALSHWYAAEWQHRRQVVVGQPAKPGPDLRDFPVPVSLRDDALRDRPHGGQVAGARAADLVFTSADGVTRLDHELSAYDPATGALRAWVRVPVLSGSADTVLYLYFGNPAAEASESGCSVWDADYRLVMHTSAGEGPGGDSSRYRNHGASVDGESPAVLVKPSDSLDVAEAVTVEAWVEADDPGAEALQSLVAKWSLRPELGAADAFDAYDAGETDGLATKGFFGAVFDGRYVYFSPQCDGVLPSGQVSRHGRVLRYDTHGRFGEPSSWSAYDPGQTSGLNTKGYYGAVATSRYVYFVPRFDGVSHHSRVLRYDRTGDFRDPDSWQAHDAGNPVSYQSAAYDGQFIYFAPGYEDGKPSGKVLRLDTRGVFDDPASYATYDAGSTSGLSARCYDGAVFDGRYVYFAPLDSAGIVLRHDTHGDFASPESWAARDAGPHPAAPSQRAGDDSRAPGPDQPGMGSCVGAVFDGQYVYFVPYAHSVVVRYDTRGDFQSAGSWSARDASQTSGLKTTGYDGAAFDGRYVYFIPFWEGENTQSGWHGKLLRYDTRLDFSDGAAWTAADAGCTGGLATVGFNGGAFDGRFLYLAPWREGSDPEGRPLAHGRVLRYDTTGSSAAFSLRYCDVGHNGGLCAALPGPSFLVNTDRGVIGVRADRALPPGWHYLAGVYDGSTVSLYVDGALAAETPGSGRIAGAGVGVAIGRIQDGLGYFRGQIAEVRASGVARSAEWIREAGRWVRADLTP